MISEGRLLISEKNVTIIPTDDQIDYERLVQARSSIADLVMVGFTDVRLRQKAGEAFLRFPDLRTCSSCPQRRRSSSTDAVPGSSPHRDRLRDPEDHGGVLAVTVLRAEECQPARERDLTSISGERGRPAKPPGT